jgi:hypothetical protein
MFDRSRSILLVGLLLFGAATARAQSAADWRAQRDAKSAESKLLRDRLQVVERQRDSARTTLRVAGIRLKLSDTTFTDADTAAFAAGIRQAMERLTTRYGPGIAAYVDARAWNAYTGRFNRFAPSAISLIGPGGSGVDRNEWYRPLRAERIALAMEEHVSYAVTGRVRELRGYPSGALFRGMSEEEWFIAGRDLSLAWASVGRRCAAGTLTACETLLAPFDSANALDRYFDRSDHRMLGSTGELPANADSATFALRRLCRDGVDTACTRLVRQVRITDPTGSGLRGTLAAHAFELAGDSAIVRLATAPPGTPLPLLAHVAGTTPEALVRSWRERLARGLTEGRIGSAALALTTALWCGLILVVIGRRRPA